MEVEAKYVDIQNLSSSYTDGTRILIRGRIETMRIKKNIIFLIIRKQLVTIQVIAIKEKIKKPSFSLLSKVPNESIIDIYGQITKPPSPIEKVTFKDIEIELDQWKCVSASQSLPFSVLDANDCNINGPNVDLSTRLDSPWINYRAPINLSIQRIQFGICLLFREFLNKNGFQEIHTPKIIGLPTEGGSEVFPIKYFDKNVFLAQSPQLYKQMMINSDFGRVYEIGPIFRAENSFSGRHMCEFTGMDIEMEIEPEKDYYQVIIMIWNVLTFIFNQLKIRFSKELEYIREKQHFSDPLFTSEPLILEFKVASEMLSAEGFEQPNNKDISTECEKKLGQIVREKYNSDLFVLEKYPTNTRPFYTMQCEDSINYIKSYDIIFKGQEISSGAQRINDYESLIKNVLDRGINPETIRFYLDSFKHGSYPHGGCGLGLERIVSLYLELGNIRRASLFPRDPKRVVP